MAAHFKPHHINAVPDDLAGNDGIGRYILLPGSDGRAKEIATHFQDVVVKMHPRGHHLYLGNIESSSGKKIAVATISSGMGCPSMEIILHELFRLGGKRFLRVGTAGSLQPNLIKIGDFINVQASVRDEQTTTDYVPLAIPAIASSEFTLATKLAAVKCSLLEKMFTGTVHCKSSFYAREFGAGPKSQENIAYINLLTQCGILATEMETAALFIQSQLYNHEFMQMGKGPAYQVLSGAILAIVAEIHGSFVNGDAANVIIENLIQLGLETIKSLAEIE